MTIDLDEAMQRAEAGQLLTRRHGEALANALKSSRARVAALTAELAALRKTLDVHQQDVEKLTDEAVR